MKWHIGCSGFHYKHWKELFYPQGLPQTKWFAHYCQHFDTLELNVTFYNFPKISSLQKWYADSPPGFTFAVKAYRGITHYNKFNNVQDRVNELYEVITNGLQEKLGPVLFQMPPNFVYSEERLDKILRSLDPSFTNVVEMRHESWWKPDVYAELTKRNISFCGMSHPTLPADVIQNTPTLYYRLHVTSNYMLQPIVAMNCRHLPKRQRQQMLSRLIFTLIMTLAHRLFLMRMS
jgi:uncharacterized protein YecE (DUF72 family)